MLILDSSVEAMMPLDDIYRRLITGIEKQRLDPGRACVITCNLQCTGIFEERYLTSLPNKPQIVNFDTCFWLLAGLNHMTPGNEIILHTRHQAVERSLDHLRPFKYVSFNGRLRHTASM